MKEYKYKINGNVYKVAIGDIEDNIAHVEVNGTPYKVEMEKAGELSGYQASIDPDQDILTSSQLQVVIKNVPVGVMRVVNIKIGLTTKLT